MMEVSAVSEEKVQEKPPETLAGDKNANSKTFLTEVLLFDLG